MSVYDARPLGRRAVLAGGAALGLAGAVGCSNDGRGASGAGNDEAARSKIRPAYERYTGVKPDLAGAEYNIPDAFNKYPADPVQAINAAPGDGKPITVTTYTNTPIPPKLEQNTFWQEFNKRVGSPVTPRPPRWSSPRPRRCQSSVTRRPPSRAASPSPAR